MLFSTGYIQKQYKTHKTPLENSNESLTFFWKDIVILQIYIGGGTRIAKSMNRPIDSSAT